MPAAGIVDFQRLGFNAADESATHLQLAMGEHLQAKTKTVSHKKHKETQKLLKRQCGSVLRIVILPFILRFFVLVVATSPFAFPAEVLGFCGACRLRPIFTSSGDED